MTISAPPSASAPSCQGLKRPSAPPKGRSAEVIDIPCAATAAARLFRLLFHDPSLSAAETYRRAAQALNVSPDTAERIDTKATHCKWVHVHRMMLIARYEGKGDRAAEIMGWTR